MSEIPSNDWAVSKPFSELLTRDFETAGVVFECRDHLYRTTGKKLGHGGMGTVYLMARRGQDDQEPQAVVGKVFHIDFLLALRTDDVAREEHERVMVSVDSISQINHPNLLPTYVSSEIADNYLIISPLRSGTLREVVAQENLSAFQKVELIIQAMKGISALHKEGFLHRDFTLGNILVDADMKTAYLFDFDLALRLQDVKDSTYKARFGGRIFGSPGYSLAPEILDDALMALPIGTSLDIYALGTSIFALFTENLPYGEAEDLWSLLLRVSKGMVRGGHSYIEYPRSVPHALRPVIESCMQRTPSMRPKSVDSVIDALQAVLPNLKKNHRRTDVIKKTMSYGDSSRLRSARVSVGFPEPGVERTGTEAILKRNGYQIRRPLGKIKGNEIFVAAPNPQLVALGQFSDGNPYPKIVTVLDLSTDENPQLLANTWQSVYQPALAKARQGLMTSLHRVIYDEPSQLLLLLSEYVEDARFGHDLSEQVLELHEAFGLAYLLSKQVSRLHENGLAHNNVCASSLLLKGIRENHCVHPAMVGIVKPSQDPHQMREDARQMARLLLSWLSDTQIADSSSVVQAKIQVIQSDLREQADSTNQHSELSQVINLSKDALAALDFNFGVLREHGGDLQAYALVLVSYSLYSRLWH